MVVAGDATAATASASIATATEKGDDASGYARRFEVEAVDQLVKLGRQRKTPPGARVMAWREVLDRGRGKPVHAITGKDGGLVHVVVSSADARL